MAKDAFIITSCCNIDNSKPLHYCNVRSIYTNEERFEQTLQTIASVRKYLPSADIWIAECSSLSPEKIRRFKEVADYYIDFSTDQAIYQQSISPYKGPAELMMTKKMLMMGEMQNYRKIYKFSGRYLLHDKFNPENFSEHEPTFRVDPDTGGTTTTLYSIPSSKIEIYIRDIDRVVAELHDKPISIEAMVGKTLPYIHKINELGLMGYVAVDGTHVYQ